MRQSSGIKPTTSSAGIEKADIGRVQGLAQSINTHEDPPVLNIREDLAHPNNYGERPAGMPITLIVLHYTATGSLVAAVNWFKNSSAKVSAHYVIDRDGTIVRMVPEAQKAYHAGKSEWRGRKDVNRFSIGIELVSWGKLVQRDGQFFSWPNDYANLYRGLDPVFLEDTWWAPYPDTQLTALHSLLNDLATRHSISDIVGHRDVAPNRKCDPGPSELWDKDNINTTI